MPGADCSCRCGCSTRHGRADGPHEIHGGAQRRPRPELAGLAKQLEEAGAHSSYEQVMQAVSDFEKGNLRLSTVLTALEHERKG